MAQNKAAENGGFSFTRTGSMGRQGLPKIQTHPEATSEVCHDDSGTPVKAKTIDELHSLQKKKSSQPTTPINGTQGSFAAISEEDRQKQQLQSISASLASLTRETGPKVVKGDPARKSEGQKATHVEHHLYDASLFGVSDSALKFTHILYNLSPAELYEQAIKYEKGSFITATGALATLSGAKTGRSPRDKRVVKDEETENELWWGKGSPNIEMDEHTFLVNRERAVDYLNSLDKHIMGSSNENGGAWSMMEDVSLCEAWVQISHCPVTGNEIKFSHMWKKIHQAFCERAIGSTRTEMALSSRWKVLNKELGKWRNALAKAIDNQRSGENLSNEIIQAQMWFGATGQGKKGFNHTHCWEVVKTCKRFQIIPTGPTVVLNETPLRETPASDSPMDSPMNLDSPIENEPRPIGRKAAKAKRGSNSSKNASQFLEELSKHQAMRIEMDLKQQEHDMAIQVEYAKEREYVRKEREYVREQNIEKKDRETMAMDTSHMSPETKQYWKLERRDIMRRRLFRDDGPSNTDWLNDGNH